MRSLLVFSIIPVFVMGSLQVRANEIADAITNGELQLSFRYRYEMADDGTRPDTAHASTLKTRLGLTSRPLWGLRAQLEVDNVTVVGNRLFDDLHHDSTNRAVVADNQDTEVNQAWISYSGVSGTELKLGRQRINLDNQRFIGGVGWRQNEQTYDSLTLRNGSLENLSLGYSYVFNVNRVFGPDDGRKGTPAEMADLDSSSHFLHLDYTGFEFGSLGLYNYRLDFDRAPALSTNTTGVRLNGRFEYFNYRLEYARQRDNGGQPIDFDAAYYNLEVGLAMEAVGIRVGLETLESDKGLVGFSTPLATGHKFNGWADRFLATPADGLEDSYVSLHGSVLGGDWQATYHRFESNRGDIEYGDEIDLSYGRTFTENISGLLKYARYRADEFSSDTDKFWLQIQWHL